jgi:SpoVK/Ycf46/Vps4 family AAA+-type ATPase
MERWARLIDERLAESLLRTAPQARHQLDALRRHLAAREPLDTRLLLSGPPLSGKSLAAAWLARELGRPLYRVDLSRVVSTYIGETEKNLALLFTEAERSGAALLFDDAGELFGERTGRRAERERPRWGRPWRRWFLRRRRARAAPPLDQLRRFGGLAILCTAGPIRRGDPLRLVATDSIDLARSG